MVANPTRGANKHTGLLVDFGGVLTTSVWDSFADFCRAKGLEENAVKRLFREDPDALADLRALETGELEEDEFERRFAKRLGLADAADLIESLFRGMKPAEPMVDAVRSAHDGGVRTGLVSNSWSTTHYDRDLLGELFDVVVISAEVGLHKPQPEIYVLAADRLGEPPERCVFVDDLRENCAGAEAVGMTAVLHRDAEETISRLEELLGIDTRGSAEAPRVLGAGGDERDAK
jgi:epoxide hydrolase-like predicted phosphatase